MPNWYAPKAWMIRAVILLVVAFAVGQAINDRPADFITSALIRFVDVQCVTRERSAAKLLTVSTGARLLDRRALAIVRQWRNRARPVDRSGCHE